VKHDVIVGVGSNINPLANIEQALAKIKEKAGDIQISRFVETEPIGFKNQDDFLNGAVRFKTNLDRDATKRWLFSLESALGRVRTGNRNGPRTMDLDILVWDGVIVDDDVSKRAFLQDAINELSPGLVLKHAEDLHRK